MDFLFFFGDIYEILQNKLTFLAKLTRQMDKQVKFIDQNDEPSLTKILDEKESVIESLVSEDQELKKVVALLDDRLSRLHKLHRIPLILYKRQKL